MKPFHRADKVTLREVEEVEEGGEGEGKGGGALLRTHSDGGGKVKPPTVPLLGASGCGSGANEELNLASDAPAA